MHNHTACICLTFLRCVFSDASSNPLPEKRHSHIGCICWLFSDMSFQMKPQIVCLKGCTITLVAIVWHFPTVGFQMCPQMVCIRGCIITLLAFVDFSSFCVFKFIFVVMFFFSVKLTKSREAIDFDLRRENMRVKFTLFHCLRHKCYRQLRKC